ncbi:Orange carotenoid protein [Oculatella sp. LEGE 06141]|uniref:orange carotenoid protein N-terminal domain-containing protein n=1 Tax=Oculatella sp. LEGE 06141 TaxID=1828648 RepID=UPI00187FF774|nr:orange carotenoid protein N-terminal domain-containing protein [Oculatella sp. LEGE 06141]MBE9180373.1 Orange carotenoid protein [Oculatella sp. LEGE 06141]
MTYATDNNTKKAIDSFRRFDVDTQLALLWYGYLDIKDQLTPAPPAESETLAKALYDGIEARSPQEQLQAQRDIASGAQSDFSKQYAALDPSARIELWFKLAQGMESGKIIQLPSDYQLPAETNEFTEQIKQLEFEQRINFMRSIVREMGASATR